MLIEELMKVRRKERALMAERDAKSGARGAYPARYTYAEEPFSIRRKEFWPLSRMEYLLSSFIPTLSHESDGLIFQVPGLPCMPPSACGALLYLSLWPAVPCLIPAAGCQRKSCCYQLSTELSVLVVQSYSEPYVSGTDFNLLKWKFAHLNSVDFLLRSTLQGQSLLACGVLQPKLMLVSVRPQPACLTLTLLYCQGRLRFVY